MQILVEIPDNQSVFFLKLTGHFNFIKVMPLSINQAFLLKEPQESFEEVKPYKQGKKKRKTAKDLLDEL